MTDAPNIAPDNPLTEEQLYSASRFVTHLLSQAEWGHRDAGKRWRAQCICGDRWPCPEQASLRDGAKLIDTVISELEYRRKYSRPLNGLERVQLAVQQSRGGNSAPPMPRGHA